MGDIDLEKCIKGVIERAIEYNETWVTDMIMNEKDEDLMFKRAIQAYEAGRELCKEEEAL